MNFKPFTVFAKPVFAILILSTSTNSLADNEPEGMLKIFNSQTDDVAKYIVTDENTGKRIYTCKTKCRKTVRGPKYLDVNVKTRDSNYEFNKIPTNGLNYIFGFSFRTEAVKSDDPQFSRPNYPTLMATPITPHKANRSGHCVLEHTLSSQGLPENLNVVSCSEGVFRKTASISAIMTRYFIEPSIENHDTSKIYRYKIMFVMRSQSGKIVPEYDAKR